jgi:hypothetical protein
MRGQAKKGFYLNPAAQLYLSAEQQTKIWISGRGSSKSFSNGISVLQKVGNLPRSKGLFVGETYTSILTNTLLPMKAAWEWFGYEEGVDYVVGKKPPHYFDKPYQSPARYENVITWWNGTTIILTSMDRSDLSRGGNNDWMIVDEAFRINKTELDQVMGFTIRGSHPLLQYKPGHLSREYTSSMPYGNVGKWLLEYEVLGKNPDNDIYFIESNSWVNRVILTEKVLKQWKRDSPPSLYAIEVMNQRINIMGDRFYPSMQDHHWYSKNTDNYSVIDKLGTTIRSGQRNSTWDLDCNPDMPLNISHDWGAFNCLTVDQEYKEPKEVRFLNYMYVTHPLILDDLANQFCEYYRHHKNKTVLQWGDKSGNNKVGNAKQSNFEQFGRILEAKGWRVIRQSIGDAEHLARHNFINKLHREEDTRLPVIRYNANNCKDLRIALESAPMKADKKDKRSENNRNIKPEHATHGTDAHDYRLWHGFYHLIREPIFHSPVTFGG